MSKKTLRKYIEELYTVKIHWIRRAKKYVIVENTVAKYDLLFSNLQEVYEYLKKKEGVRN